MLFGWPLLKYIDAVVNLYASQARLDTKIVERMSPESAFLIS